MKLMSHATPKYRPDNALILPPSITSGMVNGATLPVKIEAARAAIAKCTELPELLRYKSQAEGLAAAVRTIKEVGPEMIHSANCLVADAWRKGGELLRQYSGVQPGIGQRGNRKGGTKPSPRSLIAIEVGITPAVASKMVRVAKAPKATVYDAIQTSRSLETVARKLPTLRSGKWEAGGPAPYSQAMRSIMGTGMNKGLGMSYSALKRTDLSEFHNLTPDERKIVKAKITEIMELLDEMDRLCR